MASNNQQQLMRRLRLWRAAAVVLAMALVVSVWQVVRYRQALLQVAAAEVQMEAAYGRIVNEVQRAFDMRGGDRVPQPSRGVPVSGGPDAAQPR